MDQVWQRTKRLRPLHAALQTLIRCCEAWGVQQKRPRPKALRKSRRPGGKRSPVEGVAADPSYRLSVAVKGPIPHDSAPNPLAMFVVAIW
jgi:hypothetical protein